MADDTISSTTAPASSTVTGDGAEVGDGTDSGERAAATGPGAEASADRTASARVASLDDLDVGAMRVVEVGEQRVALIRTSAGVFALDNACPHQGYGLVTGALGDDTVTCQWHNWKFDVATGHCLLGEEDVACHQVAVADDGSVTVTVTQPSDAEARDRLWPSFGRGLANDYMGQVSRDTLRLLDAGAGPTEIMAEGLARTIPRTEFGLGHELAMAADCLAWTERLDGDDRLLPLIQGLSGLAESTRGRPLQPVPDAAAQAAANRPVDELIESEDVEGAMAATLARLDGAGAGQGAKAAVEPADLRAQFIRAASAHHLGYGHGAIYTQKSFEMLDRIGWEHAPSILPYLAMSLTYGTREDTLPYMAKARRALADIDLAALAAASASPTADRHALATALVEADDHPLDLAAAAIMDGHGVEGLLDAVTEAVCLRLLDHDLSVEVDTDDGFGWLDITHGLTLSEAARWAWRQEPGPDTARLALFAAWLAHDTGRHQRRVGAPSRYPSVAAVAERFGTDGSVPAIPPTAAASRHSAGSAPVADGGVGSRPERGARPAVGDSRGDDLGRALLDGDEERAVALALGGGVDEVAASLARAALDDRSGAFIVMAHLIKTTEAATREARRLGSTLPLAATARFVAAPRLERFVARNVADTLGFIRTGRPPRR